MPFSSASPKKNLSRIPIKCLLGVLQSFIYILPFFKKVFEAVSLFQISKQLLLLYFYLEFIALCENTSFVYQFKVYLKLVCLF